MKQLRGELKVDGSIAYTSQNPWITNATLKDNITMGIPYDPIKFRNVADCCGLLPDLEIIQGGKNCEVSFSRKKKKKKKKKKNYLIN